MWLVVFKLGYLVCNRGRIPFEFGWTLGKVASDNNFR